MLSCSGVARGKEGKGKFSQQDGMKPAFISTLPCSINSGSALSVTIIRPSPVGGAYIVPNKHSPLGHLRVHSTQRELYPATLPHSSPTVNVGEHSILFEMRYWTHPF